MRQLYDEWSTILNRQPPADDLTADEFTALGFSLLMEILFKVRSWDERKCYIRQAATNRLDKPSTTVFLERFFENLLFQGKSELKNRFCHILWKEEEQIQSAISKCQNVTLEESLVLKIIAANPRITQKMIADAIKKSDRTVKRITSSLQEKGLLSRKNGKRSGVWEILQ